MCTGCMSTVDAVVISGALTLGTAKLAQRKLSRLLRRAQDHLPDADVAAIESGGGQVDPDSPRPAAGSVDLEPIQHGDVSRV